MISATRNMQIISATVWADFKGYGKGEPSEEDWQNEAMRPLGDAGDDLPNDDEEHMAAWEQMQGAHDEAEEDYDPWGNEMEFSGPKSSWEAGDASSRTGKGGG